jgi:hypothetical protein
MEKATELFENTLKWLRDNYAGFQFFLERDVVWTVQNRIIEQIKELALPYRIFNDYPMLPGKRRSLSTDLAILGLDDSVEVAAELKYEPSHRRTDLLASKFPVVFWGEDGVAKDLRRIQEFVAQSKAKVAYSVFIDEGGYFRNRQSHLGSEWIDWGNGVWVLYGQAQAVS